MSSLSDVVDQLQDQNKSMGDVRDGINAILDIQVKEVQERAEAEKDKLEAEIEASQKAKASKAADAKAAGKATTFTGGLLEGLDTFGILSGLKNVLSSALGLASGLALGPLLGKFIGKFIVGGLGMWLGEKYLTGFMDKLIPDAVGKMKFDTIFGEKSVEEIAAALAGGIGFLFGPTLIRGALGLLWGKPGRPTGRASKAVWGMLKKANPLRLLGTSGTAMGSMIKGLLGVSAMKGAFMKTASWALFAARWGMTGPLAIPLLLIGAALALTIIIGNHMEKKRQKMQDDLKRKLIEMDDEFDAALAAGDFAKAANTYDDKMEIAKHTTTFNNPYLEPRVIANLKGNLDDLEEQGYNVKHQRAVLEATATNTVGIEELEMMAKQWYNRFVRIKNADLPAWEELSKKEQVRAIATVGNDLHGKKVQIHNDEMYDLSGILAKWERGEIKSQFDSNQSPDKLLINPMGNASLLPQSSNNTSAIQKSLNTKDFPSLGGVTGRSATAGGPPVITGQIGDNNSYTSTTSSIFPSLHGNPFDPNAMLWRGI